MMQFQRRFHCFIEIPPSLSTNFISSVLGTRYLTLCSRERWFFHSARWEDHQTPWFHTGWEPISWFKDSLAMTLILEVTRAHCRATFMETLSPRVNQPAPSLPPNNTTKVVKCQQEIVNMKPPTPLQGSKRKWRFPSCEKVLLVGTSAYTTLINILVVRSIFLMPPFISSSKKCKQNAPETIKS